MAYNCRAGHGALYWLNPNLRVSEDRLYQSKATRCRAVIRNYFRQQTDSLVRVPSHSSFQSHGDKLLDGNRGNVP